MNAKKAFGWFIILTMVFSGFGFVLQDNADGSQTYNDIKFIPAGNGWNAKINGKIRTFNFFPGNLESIQTPGIEELTKAKALAITYNPDTQISPLFAQLQYDYEQNLKETTYIIRAATNGTILPEMTCKNATQTIPVIQFEESNTTEIIYENNCLTIKSYDGYGFAMNAEKIQYILLGVMK